MSNEHQKTGLSYKDAGVDIDAGEQLVTRIKTITESTKRAEVLGGIGGFGALCAIPSGYQNPVLVAGTDGVGTKLKLAIDHARHESVGIDLVAMCVNDLVVQGAEPLFFLDYYATGKLDVNVAEQVVAGIGEGCRQAGCALIGGETAEMPGMYSLGDYDLAGFCVGVVERDKIIDGSAVRPGDKLIALASSGPHSNGYSLIRKVIDISGAKPDTMLDNQSLLDHVMAPTRIYVKTILALLKKTSVHAIAHITGGGLIENIPRVLPKGTMAIIDRSTWEWPTIFQWLQKTGNIDENEMFRTFNCGVGMVLAVPEAREKTALAQLAALGERAWTIGHVDQADAQQRPCVRFC